MDIHREAGAFLYNQYLSQDIMDPLPEDLAPKTICDAYLIQEEYLGHISESRGPVGGCKLAYTTTAMQVRAGLNEPCAGKILSKTIMHSPAILYAKDYVNLGVECEIAVKLSSDLTPYELPFTRQLIETCINSVMPAFEIVDFRTPDLQGVERSLTAISTNISNAGVILGKPIQNWANLDLAAARGEMKINGKLVGEGLGSDIMGHPFEPLVWLANKLCQEGKIIPQDSIIITGSIVTPKYLRSGDTAIVSIQHLGEAHLTVV
jgi:2-oxo-3-hexenedioate decarboxylase/2-keto-4-pentenoate hydratase